MALSWVLLSVPTASYCIVRCNDGNSHTLSKKSSTVSSGTNPGRIIRECVFTVVVTGFDWRNFVYPCLVPGEQGNWASSHPCREAIAVGRRRSFRGCFCVQFEGRSAGDRGIRPYSFSFRAFIYLRLCGLFSFLHFANGMRGKVRPLHIIQKPMKGRFVSSSRVVLRT